MERRRVLAPFIVLLTVGATAAHADIRSGLYVGRVDATYTGSGYRTWSSDAQTGAILSRQDVAQSVGTSLWINHGYGTAPCNANGPAATGYNDGTNNWEWVGYVGTDGNLNFGSIENGGPISWTSFSPPSGRTLTGHIAMTTIIQFGNRYMFLAATTTDGHLFGFNAGVLPVLSGGWGDFSGGLSWVTNNPIGVASSPDNTIDSFFAAHTPSNQQLGMFRWDGTTNSYSTTNLGAPSGRHVCRTLTATAFSPTGFAGSERTIVTCAPVDVVGGVDVAIATSYTSKTFTWATYDSGIFYMSVASVPHHITNLNPSSATDIYGSELFSNSLRKGYYDGTSLVFADLGPVGDQGGVEGLMGAVPSGHTSRDFYVGAQNSRNYLYERYGGNNTSAPQNYRAFGDENTSVVPSGAYDHYAEGKASIWQGTMAASVVNRPGTGTITDWPSVWFLYSENEGRSLHTAQQIKNVVGGTTLNYVADPTTVVTDQRVMYSFQLGAQMTQCVSPVVITLMKVYMVTTTPSTFPIFTDPVTIQTLSGFSIDHPYADIQHRAGLADLIYLAWWKIDSNIQYSAIQEGSNPIAPIDISSPTKDHGGPPRVTASDSGRVIVYYPLPTSPTNKVMFCELYDTNSDGIPDSCCINGSNCGPTTGWQVVGDGNASLAWSINGEGPTVNSAAHTYILDLYPVSMAISESGDTLYYCFEQREPTPSTTQDVFCTIGTRNPSTGLWSWNGTPVPVAGVTNDGKDQFGPEVVLTQEQGTYTPGQETAIVTFYDRSADPNNYYYQVKRTASTNRMTTTFPPRTLFGGVSSDPDYLPRHCFHSSARFIGDYSGSEGYIDHAQSLSVTVPNPGTIGTYVFTNYAALGQWGY